MPPIVRFPGCPLAETRKEVCTCHLRSHPELQPVSWEEGCGLLSGSSGFLYSFRYLGRVVAPETAALHASVLVAEFSVAGGGRTDVWFSF